ncbi:MAG TPA: ankyrin repeat domain-containing protein [Patescibacteria group bacterium]|nr:ankyrin repeat domain-containing protein [Gammaproteobacteria bacterium]HWA51524.1 ankyrin repeat domain-containing protein [Patescibacteria group bacterium]
MEQLIEAMKIDDVARTAELLQSGFGPNGYEDYAHITPLHFAAQINALQSAQLLLQAGANPRSKSIDGISPFDVACTHVHSDMVALLSAHMLMH